jgi:hypothetical protein
MKAVRTSRVLAALAILLGAALGRPSARAEEAAAAAPAEASAPTSAAAAESPVSATGLLPIFGIRVDFDGLSEKSKPEDAVAAVQKVWDSRLKNAGFNVIQVPVDVRELGDKGAGRLAKLCVWAKANNVRIAPMLLGAPAGEPLPSDYPDRVGAFATKTIELIGKAGDPSVYAQIMLYQIERPLNHAGHHGPMDAPKAAELIAGAITKLHGAEQTALAGSSLQATPVLVGVSFDYELIRVGGIANVQITDESYGQAYATAQDYLEAIMASAPVDVIGLEWYPGSLSADGVDRFPDLVGKLQTDFPGKLLLVSTGYSTAAGGEADQSKYYTQTFTNLTDLRTNQGVESSFAGILWRTAMDKPGGEPEPPSSKTLEEMPKWNWPERAAELTRMWSEPGSDSKEMRWWLGRVEGRFGLMSAGKDVSKPGLPKPVFEMLSRLKSSLAAAAAQTGAGQIANELASTASGSGGMKGVFGAVKDRLQAALFGMLDVWVAKTAENLVSGGGSGGGDAGGAPAPQPPPPPAPPALADLFFTGVSVDGELKSGLSVPITATVKNAGTATATNVRLYLKEKNGASDLAQSSTTTIPAGNELVMSVPWIPAHPGTFPNVTLEAYCDNDSEAGNNKTDPSDLAVAPADGGGGGGGGGSGGG